MMSADQLEQEQRRRLLWTYSMFMAGVALAVELFGIAEASSVTPSASPLLAARLGHALLVAGLIVWLVWVRKRFSARLCRVAGVITVVPFWIICWYAQDVIVRSGASDPFVSSRFATLAVAVTYPAPPRATLLLVTVFAALATLHLAIWRSQGLHLPMTDEPWMTLLNWAVACAIVFLRSELGRLDARFGEARAALIAVGQLARVTRAVRDGANTHLQTIEAIGFVLRGAGSVPAQSAERLDRSASHLRRIIEALKYDDLVAWEDSDVSFQAEGRLGVLQEMLMSDATLPRMSPERRDVAGSGHFSRD